MNVAASTILALSAAATFAVSAVLQQRAARKVPATESLGFGMFVDLVRQPEWLAGTASMVAGYCLQAVALSFGNVSFVAPLIVSELVFALPLAARSERRRPGGREWLGAAGVVIGVGMFLLAASPRGGHPDPALAAWGLMILPCAVVVAAAVALAQRTLPANPSSYRAVPGDVWSNMAGEGAARPGRAGAAEADDGASSQRGALLAVAAGVTFGLLAVFTKSVTYLVQHHGAGVLVSWQLYALVGIGIFGFLLSQNAYQAAALRNSLPVIDAVEPTVAVLLAAAVFGEHLSHSPESLAFEALGAAIALGGVFLVGRSPLVLSIYQPVNPAHS